MVVSVANGMWLFAETLFEHVGNAYRLPIRVNVWLQIMFAVCDNGRRRFVMENCSEVEELDFYGSIAALSHAVDGGKLVYVPPNHSVYIFVTKEDDDD